MHLVTGSSGYVGSVIVNKLLESNKEVIALDSSPSKVNSKYINKKSINLDITNYKSLEDIFISNKIESIYHCTCPINLQ